MGSSYEWRRCRGGGHAHPLGVAHEVKVVPRIARRTYCSNTRIGGERGSGHHCRCGGEAHLPGMTAAKT